MTELGLAEKSMITTFWPTLKVVLYQCSIVYSTRGLEVSSHKIPENYVFITNISKHFLI